MEDARTTLMPLARGLMLALLLAALTVFAAACGEEDAEEAGADLGDANETTAGDDGDDGGDAEPEPEPEVEPVDADAVAELHDAYRDALDDVAEELDGARASLDEHATSDHADDAVSSIEEMLGEPYVVLGASGPSEVVDVDEDAGQATVCASAYAWQDPSDGETVEDDGYRLHTLGFEGDADGLQVVSYEDAGESCVTTEDETALVERYLAAEEAIGRAFEEPNDDHIFALEDHFTGENLTHLRDTANTFRLNDGGVLPLGSGDDLVFETDVLTVERQGLSATMLQCQRYDGDEPMIVEDGDGVEHYRFFEPNETGVGRVSFVRAAHDDPWKIELMVSEGEGTYASPEDAAEEHDVCEPLIE